MPDIEEDLEVEPTEEQSLKMFTGSDKSIMTTVDDMFLYYKSKFEKNKSPINYLEEGGEARNIFEAFAYIIMEFFYFINMAVYMSFIPYAEGDFLDIHGEDNVRNPGNKSTGILIYKLPGDMTKEYDIIIPDYSVVSTEDDEGLEVETLEEVILEAGQNSVSVNAQSIFTGEEYNIKKNLLTLMENDIDEIEVYNPEDFEGGTNPEEDEDYRSRLMDDQDSLNFGSLEWWEETPKKIDGVKDVSVVNCPHGDYTIGLIINPPVDDVLDNVKDYFNIPNNYPGGITSYITAVKTVPVNIKLSNIRFSTTANPNDVKEEITTKILNYFDNLKIGQDFCRSDILELLSKIDNLIQYTLEIPSEDIVCDENSVFIAGEIILEE